MCRTLIVHVLALTICASSALAQEATPKQSDMHIGIFVGGLYSMHSGGFVFPEGGPPLASYDKGTDLGPAFGIRMDIPLLSSLQLSPRLFAECRRGDFISEPFNFEIIGTDMKPQDLVVEDELEVILRIAGIDVMLMWTPMEAGPYLLAGPSIGMKLYEEFRVTERILEPPLVTFLEGGREREMYDGDPELTRSLHLGMNLGAGYALSLNPDLVLSLEAQYLMGLQTITENDDWSLQGLRATFAILFVI